MIKNKKGITLISLIITIVIMLILAAVSINMILGDNGLFKKSKQAVVITHVAQLKEQMKTEIAGFDVEKQGGTTDDDIKDVIKYVSKNDGVSVGDSTVITDDGYKVDVSDLWRNTRTEVCKIGNTKYCSLDDAIDVVVENGPQTTIELLNNLTLYDSVVIPQNKNVVLDLSTYKLENLNTTTLINDGKFEIKNGTVASKADNSINNETTGNLILDSNLIVDGTDVDVSTVKNTGTIKVDGAKIISKNNALYTDGSSSQVELLNNANLSSNSNRAGTLAIGNGVVTINKATIKGDSYCAITADAGTITVSDANAIITSKNADSTIYSIANITISAGLVENTADGSAIHNQGGTVIIKGTASIKSERNATIFNEGSGSTLTIEGGKVENLSGETDDTAAINNNSGKVNKNGGTIIGGTWGC